MNKILDWLHGAHKTPGKIVIWAFLFGTLGFYIQVILPYDNLDYAHGSGALLTPVDPLVLMGQEVYREEGCQYCHSQNLRPFAWELLRFGDLKKFGYFPRPDAMHDFYTAPSLHGSFRIGPDLSRVASSYNLQTLKALLNSAEGAGSRSAFHAHSYLFRRSEQFSEWNEVFLSWRIRGLMNGGLPYSDMYQRGVFDNLKGKTRGDALIAYLLSLGKEQMEFAGQFYGAGKP